MVKEGLALVAHDIYLQMVSVHLRQIHVLKLPKACSQVVPHHAHVKSVLKWKHELHTDWLCYSFTQITMLKLCRVVDVGVLDQTKLFNA